MSAMKKSRERHEGEGRRTIEGEGSWERKERNEGGGKSARH